MLENKKDRRSFIKAVSAGFAVLSLSVMKALPAHARKTIGHSVSIKNEHTGEVYDGIYRVGGYYIPEEFAKISYVMRDHRQNKSRSMDPKLIDIIADIQKACDCSEPVSLLSGYRTERTNKMLRRSSSGVAKKSYHIKGKAADIKLEGVRARVLCDKAMNLRKGGVGFYPRSGFVHVDTGKVRHWTS